MLVFEVGPSASASGPMLKVPEEKAAALGEGRPPQLTHGHQGQTMGWPQWISCDLQTTVNQIDTTRPHTSTSPPKVALETGIGKNVFHLLHVFLQIYSSIQLTKARQFNFVQTNHSVIFVVKSSMILGFKIKSRNAIYFFFSTKDKKRELAMLHIWSLKVLSGKHDLKVLAHKLKCNIRFKIFSNGF